MTTRVRQRLWWLAVCWSALSGCTTDSQHGTVAGTVTLDGQPLKIGTIRFVPVDDRTAPADAPILDGKFTAKVPLGEKRVTISAPKVTGKRKMYDTPDSPTVDIVDELLPDQYNRKSTLTFTVKPGEQQLSFDLKSK